MTKHGQATQNLALLGGEPIVKEPLAIPPFPPRREEIGERLKELYLGGNWSFSGTAELEFARAFAAYHDAKHGVFMANGSVTLEAALAAHGIGAGDEVIVPALTWIATAASALHLGATPVFVDIEPDTLCLDPGGFEAAVTARTRAVIPVHLYGSMADLDVILAVAAKHQVVVIEDCAHAHGGKWNGRGVGSWGHVGSFSFQQSKPMTSGEGGICITNDDEIADRLHRVRNCGRAMPGRPESPPPEGLLCHNFRGTEFQALILHGQLDGMDALLARYNENAARLERRLAAVAGLRVQARGRRAGPQSYYCWAVILEGRLEAVPVERFIEALAAEGAPCFGVTYGPVYASPLWNVPERGYRIAHGGCPVAEGIGTKHTLTAWHPFLGATRETIDLIGDALAKVANNAEALV
ncbi:MAG TPA: DegT/DnrJ/EryC1/StrS family aminotransferase [Candidatus Hydrogenedentes bacterium]|nr:DegT/DnrJ/EryC1/StrS family aminotransferase [Candidatus Hydrogenedentota bacterium]